MRAAISPTPSAAGDSAEDVEFCPNTQKSSMVRTLCGAAEVTHDDTENVHFGAKIRISTREEHKECNFRREEKSVKFWHFGLHPSGLPPFRALNLHWVSAFDAAFAATFAGAFGPPTVEKSVCDAFAAVFHVCAAAAVAFARCFF